MLSPSKVVRGAIAGAQSERQKEGLGGGTTSLSAKIKAILPLAVALRLKLLSSAGMVMSLTSQHDDSSGPKEALQPTSQWQARRTNKWRRKLGHCLRGQPPIKIHFLRLWDRLVAFAAASRAAPGVALRFQIAHSECAFLFRWLRLARFVRHGRI